MITYLNFRKRHFSRATVAVLVLSIAASPVIAQTPWVEKGASADGKIPAYAGAQEPVSGWSYGKVRGDFWKHKGESPQFSISADNVDKYADHLTAGQIALIKAKKGYRMDVYPTHRECGVPSFLDANTQSNATQAKLGPGDSLEAANLPGTPFPEPKNGAEVMWNYLTRYRGVGVDYPTAVTVVSPRPGDSNWIKTQEKLTMYYPWGKKGTTTVQQAGALYDIFFSYDMPAALAGQGLVQLDYFDKVSDTYYYFTGQRRVRRMPSYSYDAPQIGFENQYTVDEANLFNGLLDRFNWKLVGKKEIYVPYNNFGMYDYKAKFDDVFKPEFVAPEARRYELHRVYVVEATLKQGVRHVASKKVFYFDEDSGIAVAAEDYDAQGQLWKVKENYVIPVYELGGACDAEPFAQYDLSGGRYVSDLSAIGVSGDIHWFEDSSDPRFKSDYYTSDNLQNVSAR
jgi:hypothetical protein